MQSRKSVAVRSKVEDGEVEEYRSHPATPIAMGASAELLYVTLKKEGRTLERVQAQLLGLCSTFAPLEVHADRIAKSQLFGIADRTCILEALGNLLENGLLLARSELMERAVSLPKAEGPPPISWLSIPTFNRPALLCRCLESFACHFREYGRFPRLLVTDDSNTPEARTATSTLLNKVARKWVGDVVYFGVEEKRALISRLAKDVGCPQDILEFGLLGPRGLARGAGANRNTILLHTLGDLVLSADDDTICERYAAPEASQSRLLLGRESDPYEFWFFPDRQSALRSVPGIAVDVLAAHESMLGKNVHSLADPVIGNTRLDTTYACGHLVRSLWEGRGKVFITSNGAIGDSGMYSSRNFTVHRGSGTRRRLLTSEEHYQSALRSREILRQPLLPTVSHGASFISMFFGMDNRTPLPPFFPVGHCDDGVFAFVANRCLEGCYFGYLPWALMHAPPDSRDNFGRFATTVRISDIVAACISSWPDSDPSAGSNDRMISLGCHLESIASLSEPEFQEYIRLRLWHRVAQRISFSESLIKEFGGKPEFWAKDLLRESEQSLAAILDDSYCAPIDLPSEGSPVKHVQTILLRYGRLMSYWPMILDVCRRTRA